MAANTKIEWAHHTFNPWIGCSKVSTGCQNCYAEHFLDKRLHSVKWGDNGTRVRTSEANWKKPLQWDKAAAAAGQRHRVFCASLADIFEDRAELEPWRQDLLELIYQTKNLDWLVLTKRPDFALEWLGGSSGAGLAILEDMPHLWLGTSVENQEQADKRIDQLLQIPAQVRFLSIEPLLSSVDLSPWIPAGANMPTHFSTYTSEKAQAQYFDGLARSIYISRLEIGIDWVIVGGESGPNARPMHPNWARTLRDQCAAANIPFLFKQWGEFTPFDHWPEEAATAFVYGVNIDGRSEQAWMQHCASQPGWEPVVHVGKKTAGRLLDGIEHNAFPSDPLATLPLCGEK